MSRTRKYDPDQTKIRRFDILEFIARKSGEGRNTTFAEIRQQFEKGVGATILSGDLDKLRELKLIQKQSHGVYQLAQPLWDILFAYTPYGDRRSRNKREKELISRVCITTLRADGQPLLGNKFCFICHGTSTEPLFSAFKEAEPYQRPQNVVTNSLPGMLELLDYGSIGLTIIGGTPDIRCGAIRPLISHYNEEAKDATKKSELSTVAFNVLVLSCSSIDSEGRIWCGDEMEGFRKAIIEQAKNNNADIVVLADSSKLGSIPVGVPTARIELNKETTWLFVDSSREGKKETVKDISTDKGKNDVLTQFKEKLGNHFVLVPIS